MHAGSATTITYNIHNTHIKAADEFCLKKGHDFATVFAQEPGTAESTIFMGMPEVRWQRGASRSLSQARA